MDLKRYEKISGLEALNKLLDGERIYNLVDTCWFRQGDGIRAEHKYGSSESSIPVVKFLDNTNDWYVKKPFDVRAEMLARPNEWVGAFKDPQGKWHRVGFDTKSMIAVETHRASITAPYFEEAGAERAHSDELDSCIPIEDAPKGVSL